MSLPSKSALAVLAATVSLAGMAACHPKPRMKPVTVRIFRDLRSQYANQLDRRLLEFQETNPRLGNGAPIAVETLQVEHYSTALQNNLEKDMTAELVVLNSPQDAATNAAVQAELPKSINICAALKACPAVVPAFVPSVVTGAPAEAGKLLLAFLQKPAS